MLQDYGTTLYNVSGKILAPVLNARYVKLRDVESELSSKTWELDAVKLKLRSKKDDCKYHSSRNEVCKND